MTADLVAWLTQILDEDERNAQAALDRTEQAYPAAVFAVHWRWARAYEHLESGAGGFTTEPGVQAPEQLLADIAAKRAIIALHRIERDLSVEGCVVCDNHPYDGILGGGGDGPCITLRLLASASADRPGYLDEWRP